MRRSNGDEICDSRLRGRDFELLGSLWRIDLPGFERHLKSDQVINLSTKAQNRSEIYKRLFKTHVKRSPCSKTDPLMYSSNGDLKRHSDATRTLNAFNEYTNSPLLILRIHPFIHCFPMTTDSSTWTLKERQQMKHNH